MRTGVMVICLFFSLIMAASVAAQELDLASWSELTLDLPGGQGSGNWVLSDGNTTVTQTINADPSFYHNNLNESSYTMNGTWLVAQSSDDDLMGFAFGYQDPSHCYIMDWKQGAQSAYGFRDEGFVIRKMHGAAGEMVLDDYWAHEEGTERYTVLASAFGAGMGWQDHTAYNFTLDFEPSQFTVTVRQEDSVLWETTVYDSEYMSGEFAFYNFSQANVQYSGFTQNLAPICNAGGPYGGQLGEEIGFDGTASLDPDGDIVDWAWDFGDGTIGTGPTPTHVYAEVGVYIVTLCVTDDQGEPSCCETVADITEPVSTEVHTWSMVKALYR